MRRFALEEILCQAPASLHESDRGNLIAFLHEEHVTVAYEIPVACLRVELHSKAAYLGSLEFIRFLTRYCRVSEVQEHATLLHVACAHARLSTRVHRDS